MPQNQSKDLSIFKTVATGTQILPGSVTESNNRMSQNLNMNSVMKNGKALNKFIELIAKQGGNTEYIKDTDKFKKAKLKQERKIH